jgi:hypothetical protein
VAKYLTEHLQGGKIYLGSWFQKIQFIMAGQQGGAEHFTSWQTESTERGGNWGPSKTF